MLDPKQQMVAALMNQPPAPDIGETAFATQPQPTGTSPYGSLFKDAMDVVRQRVEATASAQPPFKVNTGQSPVPWPIPRPVPQNFPPPGGPRMDW